MDEENTHIVIVREPGCGRPWLVASVGLGPQPSVPWLVGTEAWHTRHALRAPTLGSADEGEMCSREANDLGFGQSLLPQGQQSDSDLWD